MNPPRQNRSNKNKSLQLPHNKENSSHSSLSLHHSNQILHNQTTKNKSFFSIKKMFSQRKSQTSKPPQDNKKSKRYCRFSEQAKKIHESIQINAKSTFGNLERNPSICRKAVPKCLNHENKQASHYLLLAENQCQKIEKKLFYCEKCSINLHQQGFFIHSVSEKVTKFSPFLTKLNEYMNKVSSSISSLSSHPYLEQINWKINQICQKYDNIIEVILQLKKQELIYVQKFKFQMFQTVTRREKQLQGTLKKLQLLSDSYLKNSDYLEGKANQIQKQLYWEILQRQKENLFPTEISIKFNEEIFLEEAQICQKIGQRFKERIYQLSFDESSPGKMDGLETGLNATFGERQFQ